MTSVVGVLRNATSTLRSASKSSVLTLCLCCPLEVKPKDFVAPSDREVSPAAPSRTKCCLSSTERAAYCIEQDLVSARRPEPNETDRTHPLDGPRPLWFLPKSGHGQELRLGRLRCSAHQQLETDFIEQLHVRQSRSADCAPAKT